MDLGDVRRSSWYSGPSEVSLDDLELVMSKECKRIPQGQLSRCSAEGDLAPAPAIDDSMSDRRSLASIASGIYEEILDVPIPDDNIYCKMSRDANFIKQCKLDSSVRVRLSDEPQYECVAECLYGTAPPLPPRTIERGSCVESCRARVTRHGSLASLGAAAAPARTLPRWDRSRHAFSAFRKRLKSDSRTALSPKSETKEKDVETKKKKFDFAPTRDMFKSFKVSRKMKNLKIASIGKESKSCEFLDDTEHVTPNRCSKSVECLEENDKYLDGFDANVSIEFNDTVAALSLPQELVQLILNNHEKILNNHEMNEKMSINLNEVEGDYMPMSPIVPPTTALEHHYIVMSPRSNIA